MASIKKIPVGTVVYLHKKTNVMFSIQPDKVLQNDSWYVAYDVIVDRQTVIPKGTRVIGDWISETDPIPAAQLQIHRIFLPNGSQRFLADSDVVESTTGYNLAEVKYANYMYRLPDFHSKSNIVRRVVAIDADKKILADNNIDTVFLEVNCAELPVRVIEEFIAFPDRSDVRN